MEWNEHLQSANWPGAIACAVGAYTIGCFTTGYYLVRARLGKDIREMGSGSAGARNVGRFLGKTGFFLTVLGDFAKGALAIWLARMMTHQNLCAVLAVPAVVAGHLWPAQLKFRGGKGVITSLGAMLVFDYRVAFTCAGLFAVFFIFARKTLLSCMFGYLCLPAACWFFRRDIFSTGIITFLSAMILFAHRKNLADELTMLKSEPPKI